MSYANLMKNPGITYMNHYLYEKIWIFQNFEVLDF